MTTPQINRTAVSIPGDPGHLDVLRLVVRNACARRGASLDQIDDSALAVHEAGLALIEAGAEGIDMEFDGASELTVFVSTPLKVTLRPDESMSFRIIEALTEGYDIESTDDATTIRLRLRIAA
ncbi:MAG: hypothetical protein Q8Q29_02200 [Actinomycetota bacterium]|jgi:hypothetical protein|nr:hypothetical protein [Actinomycetota bacterium]